MIHYARSRTAYWRNMMLLSVLLLGDDAASICQSYQLFFVRYQRGPINGGVWRTHDS